MVSWRFTLFCRENKFWQIFAFCIFFWRKKCARFLRFSKLWMMIMMPLMLLSTHQSFSLSVCIRCEDGEAKISCGYKLPARFVISTVGPRFPVCLLSKLTVTSKGASTPRFLKVPTSPVSTWWKNIICAQLPSHAFPPAFMDTLRWLQFANIWYSKN